LPRAAGGQRTTTTTAALASPRRAHRYSVGADAHDLDALGAVRTRQRPETGDQLAPGIYAEQLRGRPPPTSAASAAWPTRELRSHLRHQWHDATVRLLCLRGPGYLPSGPRTAAELLADVTGVVLLAEEGRVLAVDVTAVLTGRYWRRSPPEHASPAWSTRESSAHACPPSTPA
jgi:hypothetical protein